MNNTKKNKIKNWLPPIFEDFLVPLYLHGKVHKNRRNYPAYGTHICITLSINLYRLLKYKLCININNLYFYIVIISEYSSIVKKTVIFRKAVSYACYRMAL